MQTSSNTEEKELGSFVRCLLMVALSFLLLIVVPLLMTGWIYEGPKRLVVKSFRRLRKGRI